MAGLGLQHRVQQTAVTIRKADQRDVWVHGALGPLALDPPWDGWVVRTNVGHPKLGCYNQG
jgi:hypothetical protein